MTAGPPSFSDIRNHWAQPFIEALAQRGIVNGFPDGSFRPEQAVSRMEFAILVQASFPTLPPQRPYVPFKDVSPTDWAAPSIQWASERGFLSGYPDQTFRPNEAIARVHTWVGLVGGLKLKTSGTVPLASLYQDSSEIPDWATASVAADTDAEIVVNHPNLKQLRPNQVTTRAEVSVILYQCLVHLGQAPPIGSDYIVYWSSEMIPSFPDVTNHWAKPFIDALTQRRIVSGFPDGTFRPEQSVSRAEFAVMAQASFPTLPLQRAYVPFKDVPTNHWAAKAIQWAYERKILSGYPDQTFRPNQAIARVQCWVALVGGLGLRSSGNVPLSTLYQDASQIPTWATTAVAAATEAAIVVSHPNLKQLRPNQPTTRAEVSVILYQCLLYLGQAGVIPSSAIVRWPVGSQTVLVSHPREFRAVWVAAVWNGDFPSKPGLSTQQQQAELIAILNQMQTLNFNALVLQVRPEGDALYNSRLEPWSNWLTGTQGKPPAPFYDPLEFAIAQCHQRGIELHAWFNPYRARTSRSTVNVAPHMAVAKPEVVYQWGNQLWMDPGAKVVEDRTYAVILDVVRRYDVDGIHLDDYFYPYPIAGQTFPDDRTYQAYQTGGGKLSLADWRRDNVNRLIQRLRAGIQAEKPHVKFGISPFGIYRPGQPPPIQGLDAYDQLYADALKWLQQGWVDYLAPQLYWRTDQPAQSYPVLLQWWVDSNTQKRHIYAGNNLSQLDGKAWTLEEIEKQVAITRNLNPQMALGNIFFSRDALAQNREGVTDRFATTTFRTPALAPAINWLQVMPPTQPLGLKVTGNRLTWDAEPNLRGWTVYAKIDDSASAVSWMPAGLLSVRWALQRILPPENTSLTLPPGIYAICGVNRLSQESGGFVATLTG